MSNLEAGTDTVPGTTPQYYLIGQRVPDAFDIIAHSHSNRNPQNIERAHKEIFHSKYVVKFNFSSQIGSAKKWVSCQLGFHLKLKTQKSQKYQQSLFYV